MELARQRGVSAELSYYGTFEETSVHVLNEAVEDDMRIFIAISDETKIRNTLCEVKEPVTIYWTVHFVVPLHKKEWRK